MFKPVRPPRAAPRPTPVPLRWPGLPSAAIVPAVPSADGKAHPLYQKVAAFLESKPSHAGKHTHFLFVLDSSGSMAAGLDITIGSFNQQRDLLQAGAASLGACTLSLLTFNDTVASPQRLVAVSQVPRLTSSNYVPCGGTALFDAIGAAIEQALAAPGAAHPDTAFFIAIFTDGAENASRYVTSEALRVCTEALQATNRFTFTFLGPEESLQSMAQMLAMAPGNLAGYNPATTDGRIAAATMLATGTSRYMASRSLGMTAVANLYTPPPANPGQ